MTVDQKVASTVIALSAQVRELQEENEKLATELLTAKGMTAFERKRGDLLEQSLEAALNKYVVEIYDLRAHKARDEIVEAASAEDALIIAKTTYCRGTDFEGKPTDYVQGIRAQPSFTPSRLEVPVSKAEKDFFDTIYGDGNWKIIKKYLELSDGQDSTTPPRLEESRRDPRLATADGTYGKVVGQDADIRPRAENAAAGASPAPKSHHSGEIVDTLNFYADRDNYQGERFAVVLKDYGKKAREAIRRHPSLASAHGISEEMKERMTQAILDQQFDPDDSRQQSARAFYRTHFVDVLLDVLQRQS